MKTEVKITCNYWEIKEKCEELGVDFSTLVYMHSDSFKNHTLIFKS